MTTTLEATTVRPVTLQITDADKLVTHIERKPAGTAVYVSRIRNGRCVIRVCGTLLEQTVALSAIDIP